MLTVKHALLQRPARRILRSISIAVLNLGLINLAVGEEIGKVDTRFRFLTPDDTVRVEVFDDPKIGGISCYLSRAKTGGVKGAIGVAEDTSDASLDCRQTGKIEFRGSFENGEKVFSERRSLIFKELQVVRYCDKDRNVLVYLVYSDRFIEGSPKNSVSAVPVTAASDSPSCSQYLE